MERLMYRGAGECCHCMIGGRYACVDGPVFRWDAIKEHVRNDKLKPNNKLRVGFFGITGCAGCLESVIFNENEIVGLFDLVDAGVPLHQGRQQ
jgi:hypothetical protein